MRLHQDNSMVMRKSNEDVSKKRMSNPRKMLMRRGPKKCEYQGFQ